MEKKVDPTATNSYPSDFLSLSYQQSPKKRRSKTKIGNQENRVIKKPNFSKKPDPLAPKITSPCTVCGKKFWSWKALFGHMRCHPERKWRGINPPPNFRPQQELPDHDTSSTVTRDELSTSSFISGESFTKMTEEEHAVADCLLLLANGPALINYHSGHQCSICFRVFSSGHALGYCHWEESTSGGFIALPEKDQVFGWDLNLPATMDDNSSCLP